MDTITEIKQKIKELTERVNSLDRQIEATRSKINELEKDTNDGSHQRIVCYDGILQSQCKEKMSWVEQIATLENRISSITSEKTTNDVDSIEISSVSEKRFKNYMNAHFFDITLKDESEYSKVSSKKFRRFKWKRDEDASTEDARKHLVTELSRFGVTFGKKHFNIYNVHSMEDLLNVESAKIGHLKGGTDLIIGPFGKVDLSIAMQTCVAIELNTESAVKRHGIKHYLRQAALELIASNFLSHQLSLVVVTDLSTSAMILVLDEAIGVKSKINISVYENLTLDQMALCIKSHLTTMCSKQSDYTFIDHETNSAKMLKTFKTKTGSPLFQSLSYEHFMDMVEYLPPFSTERAQMASYIFKEAYLPTPEILNMYL